MSIFNFSKNSEPSNNTNNAFTPLAEGMYVVAVEKVTVKYSTTGKPMLSLTYAVLEEIATKKQIQGKRKIFDNIVLIQSCEWKYLALLKALGVDPARLVNPSDEQQLVDKQMQVEVKHEEYEGVLRARAIKYLPLDNQEEIKTPTTPFRMVKTDTLNSEHKGEPMPPIEDVISNIPPVSDLERDDLPF